MFLGLLAFALFSVLYRLVQSQIGLFSQFSLPSGYLT